MGKILTWIPILERCCCLCNVRGGTIIIGWLGEIENVLKFVLCASILAQLETTFKIPSIFNLFHLVDREMGAIILIGILIESVIGFIVHGLLLYGVHNVKPRLLLVYIVTEFFLFVLASVSAVTFGIVLSMKGMYAQLYIPLICILILVIPVYFWLIVFSFYRQLINDSCPSFPFEHL